MWSLALLLTPAVACMHAEQYRLIPLGTAGDRVLALELDQRRVDGETPTSAAWEIVPHLVAIAASGSLSVRETYPALSVSGEGYAASIAPVIARARTAAGDEAGFRPVTLSAQARCGHAPVCAGSPAIASAQTDRSRYAHHDKAPEEGALAYWWPRVLSTYTGAGGPVQIFTVAQGPHLSMGASESTRLEPVAPVDPAQPAPVPHHGMSLDLIVRGAPGP